MNIFWIKLWNSVLAVAVLLGYNGILHNRKQEETISRLQYELEQQSSGTSQQGTSGSEESLYQDGTYQGEAKGFRGPIVMEAVITDGKLTELRMVSAEQEDDAYLQAASKVIETIQEKQSADVDTISGATFSSRGIIEATAEALRKAKNS